MSNLIQGLVFSFFPRKDFEDDTEARGVLEVLFSETDQGLRPRKVGAYSADLNSADANLQSAINILTGRKKPAQGERSGSLILEASKGCDFFIHWNKAVPASLPIVAGHLMFSEIQKRPDLLERFVLLSQRVAREIKPVYGHIQSMAVKNWDIPPDLRLRLPDIRPISVYGREYIDFFGADRIEKAPFEKIEKLDEDAYWLIAHSPITEEVPAERRSAIRQFLGENSFMANGKWRYKDGDAPVLDLSKFEP